MAAKTPKGGRGAVASPPSGLSRDTILACDDRGLERVDVPEWNGSVFVRVMEPAARHEWHGVASGGEALSSDEMAVQLVILCACDGEGARLFSQDDAPALRQRSGSAIDRIAFKAAAVNRLTEKSREETVKN